MSDRLLNGNRVGELWEKIRDTFSKKFTTDSTLTMKDNVLGVATPVRGVTKADFESMTDEQKKGLVVVTDEPPWMPVSVSVQDYDTDDGWHVRKWSDGYVEMDWRFEFSGGWRQSGDWYISAILDDQDTKLRNILYPLKLKDLYHMSASCYRKTGGVSCHGVLINNNSCDPLIAIGSLVPYTLSISYGNPGDFLLMGTVKGRWK